MICRHSNTSPWGETTSNLLGRPVKGLDMRWTCCHVGDRSWNSSVFRRRLGRSSVPQPLGVRADRRLVSSGPCAQPLFAVDTQISAHEVESGIASWKNKSVSFWVKSLRHTRTLNTRGNAAILIQSFSNGVKSPANHWSRTQPSRVSDIYSVQPGEP
jgi:hypothetical protein